MREAKTLLSKIVATEALRQNLLWANALLKAAPAHSGNRLPAVWHESLTLQERSMLGAYAGELKQGNAYTQTCASLPDAAQKQCARAGERMTFKVHPYNPIASRLTSGYAEPEDYGLRVADIEGVRRALIVADSMCAAGVETSDVSAAIARHEITDPYTGDPPGWDPASLAVPRRLAEGRWQDTEMPL